MRKSISKSIKHCLPGFPVLMEEAQDHHQIAGLRRPDEHIPDETLVGPDIEKPQAMTYRITLAEETDVIGRILLEVAMFDVKNLVEKLAHMEAKTHLLLGGNRVRIHAPREPTLVGICEFQLVTIVDCLVGGECGTDLWDRKMSKPNQLIFNLFAFRFKLESVGERLPFASAASAEMLAERLHAVF